MIISNVGLSHYRLAKAEKQSNNPYVWHLCTGSLEDKDVPYTDRADQLVHVYMDIMVSELLRYDHSYVII